MVWGSCNNSLWRNLNDSRTQLAIHIITEQHFKNNTEQTYNELEVLNVQQLIDLTPIL